jgi:hypothetical protein
VNVRLEPQNFIWRERNQGWRESQVWRKEKPSLEEKETSLEEEISLEVNAEGPSMEKTGETKSFPCDLGDENEQWDKIGQDSFPVLKNLREFSLKKYQLASE